MSPIQNARVLFNSVPKGFPVPGETTVYDTTPTIDPDTVPLNGGFLIKTLVLSVDPYFRVAMGGSHLGFTLGSPLAGFGVAVVVRSETPSVAVGKHVYGHTIVHQEYNVIPELGALQIMEKHPNLLWSTAYMGWKEYSNAKAGKMVIQLAKKDGLKVIASAGLYVAFNYKTTDTRAVLQKEGPIDMYATWDNVGGDALEAALETPQFMRDSWYASLQCGSISGYNSARKRPKCVSLMFHHINAKALHVHGIIMDTLPLEVNICPEFYATYYRCPAQLREYGELKYTEEVGDVILAVQKGTNKAKAVVLVAEE
ncbi:chaperonin 10-like protein [Mycena alexandri]|uniref:Chaperonin 10-like protein n=1 Tax=Mycena alexandri TaxID=1745969 RepID=A0AAD6RWF7_9AGAR|nr:chaperonin 10-like protein [Mycena alexandri]